MMQQAHVAVSASVVYGTTAFSVEMGVEMPLIVTAPSLG